MAIVLAALAVLLLALLWIVNSFFFESAVRHVFGVLEQRSGVTADCEGIDGSLFSGKLALRDCQFARATHPISTFDLSVEEVTVDLRMTSFLTTATFETAAVTGLTGWVVKAPAPAEDDGAGEAQIEKPRRDFVIHQLALFDADVAVSGTNGDGNAYTLAVRVDTLSSAPLRSRMALFDILFRSNGSGHIANAPFSLASRKTPGEGRETQWRATGLPVASLGAASGGILSWFSSGVVDVYVDDQWALSGGADIDMDWRLDFHRLEVAIPQDTGPLTQLVSDPFVRYVNGFDGEFPLEFSMRLNDRQFEYKASLQAAGLWGALGESVNAVVRELSLVPTDADATGNALKEGAMSVLERLRRGGKDEKPQ
ncbi:MAG: hypothetical protein AAF184_17060 [Pseudomonadota bacterium]